MLSGQGEEHAWPKLSLFLSFVAGDKYVHIRYMHVYMQAMHASKKVSGRDDNVVTCISHAAHVEQNLLSNVIFLAGCSVCTSSVSSAREYRSSPVHITMCGGLGE